MEAVTPYALGILTAYAVFGVGLLTPGPNILSIMGTAMSVDRPSARSLARGVATGSLLWGLIAWFGLAAAIAAHEGLFLAIKLAGGLYLGWLAFKSFRSAARPRRIEASGLEVRGGRSAYWRRGLLVQMTNPKAALTWAATISLGLSVEAPWWIGGIIVAGTTIMSFAGYLTYATAFSTAPMVRAYTAARRWVELVLGGAFGVAAWQLLGARAP